MPTLPAELKREVFEFAVWSDRDNAAQKLNLSLVAQRVRLWVDLVFYRFVIITSENAAKFLPLLDSPRYQGFFPRAVRTLCLQYEVKPEQAFRILSECTGVQVLACWVEECRNNSWDLSLHLSRLPLRRLFIDFSRFSNIPFAPSTWLSDLTHLDLYFWWGRPVFPETLGQSVSRLPRLTHVGLSSSSAESHVEALCSSCLSLQVLVIIDLGDFDPNDYPPDPRIVVIEDDPHADFATTYCSPTDVWARADTIMAQRRAALNSKD